MLRLDRVQVTLGTFTLTADLAIPAGSRVAVMGPSGSGKSTLLALIAGFQRPQSGQVVWQGRDLGSVGPGTRPVSMLFQDNNLFPHLSVARNVGLALRPDLRLDRTEWARVEAVLDRVGLGGFGPRMPRSLSGGQAGRAALARVLLRARPVLLLDEPFAALGPALRQEMLGLVAQITQGTGAIVMMVTHDPRDARRIADLTIVVANGQASAPMATDALLDDPPPVLRDYLGG